MIVGISEEEDERKFVSNRKMHSEVRHNLSPFAIWPIVIIIYERRIRLVRREATMGDIMNAYKSLLERVEGRNHARDVDRDERMMTVMAKSES